MTLRYLVLAATRYDFAREGAPEGSDRIKGAKLHCVDLDEGVAGDNAIGCQPIVLDADAGVFNAMKKVPAYFDLTARTKNIKAKDGAAKVGLHITAATFAADLFAKA